MKKLLDHITQAWRWLFGSENTVVDICIAFALFTAFNSTQMVLGYDTPKEGTFAFVHLMLRLAIITFAFLIWDYEDAVADVKTAAGTLRDVLSAPSDLVRTFLSALGEHPFKSLCVLFTCSTVVLCFVTIVLVPEPAGGPALYAGLVGKFFALGIVAYLYRLMRSIGT